LWSSALFSGGSRVPLARGARVVPVTSDRLLAELSATPIWQLVWRVFQAPGSLWVKPLRCLGNRARGAGSAGSATAAVPLHLVPEGPGNPKGLYFLLDVPWRLA